MPKSNLFEVIKPYGWLLIIPTTYLTIKNYQLRNDYVTCQTNLLTVQAELEECRAAVVPPSTVSYSQADRYVDSFITNNANYAAAFQISTDMIRSLYADMFTNPTISGYRGYYGLDATQNPTKEFVIFRGIDNTYAEVGGASSSFMSFSHDIPTSRNISSMFYNPCPKYCDRGPIDTNREYPGWQ